MLVCFVRVCVCLFVFVCLFGWLVVCMFVCLFSRFDVVSSFEDCNAFVQFARRFLVDNVVTESNSALALSPTLAAADGKVIV